MHQDDREASEHERTGASEDSSKLDALVARGQGKLTRNEIEKAKDLERQKPSLRREMLSTSPLGYFATSDSLVLFAVGLMLGFAGAFAVYFEWLTLAEWQSVVLAIAASLFAACALFAAAWLSGKLFHRAARQWAADLPFEMNYPQVLGQEFLEYAELEIEFGDESPGNEVVRAAILGLDRKWIDVGVNAGRNDGRMRVSLSFWYVGRWHHKAHRRIRWVTKRLLLPLHQQYPIASVRLEGS